jgi:hypothetical protein
MALAHSLCRRGKRQQWGWTPVGPLLGTDSKIGHSSGGLVWPNPDLPFSGENRKNRTFTRGSETGLPRRGRSRREHALADGVHRSSPRDGRDALCWVLAFPHCGLILMLQKNPESEPVSRNEVGGSQLPRQEPGVIGLVQSVQEIGLSPRD